jgi:proline iminopeptidase
MNEYTTRRSLYPPIEPNRTGMLDVGDGHRMYYEECGNPHGKPVVFLHGGPGGGCNANMRRFSINVYRSCCSISVAAAEHATCKSR